MYVVSRDTSPHHSFLKIPLPPSEFWDRALLDDLTAATCLPLLPPDVTTRHTPLSSYFLLHITAISHVKPINCKHLVAAAYAVHYSGS